jgi:hypothetical protein
MIVIYILLGFIINMAVGAIVWKWLDDEDRHLHKWLTSCPPEISLIGWPLALSAWPVALLLYWDWKSQ